MTSATCPIPKMTTSRIALARTPGRLSRRPRPLVLGGAVLGFPRVLRVSRRRGYGMVNGRQGIRRRRGLQPSAERQLQGLRATRGDLAGVHVDREGQAKRRAGERVGDRQRLLPAVGKGPRWLWQPAPHHWRVSTPLAAQHRGHLGGRAGRQADGADAGGPVGAPALLEPGRPAARSGRCAASGPCASSAGDRPANCPAPPGRPRRRIRRAWRWWRAPGFRGCRGNRRCGELTDPLHQRRVFRRQEAAFAQAQDLGGVQADHSRADGRRRWCRRPRPRRSPPAGRSGRGRRARRPGPGGPRRRRPGSPPPTSSVQLRRERRDPRRVQHPGLGIDIDEPGLQARLHDRVGGGDEGPGRQDA